ncbi:MAG TPA: thioesterase family protein [Nocardioidaceae bacterium]|nr:thioesterase family protein [Nocardioidaceae bacterium]
MDPTLTPFADASRLTPRADGSFDGLVDAGWTIGGKPNGGYLLAMLAAAAGEVVPHDHVLAASAHFLHSPDPGPVTVTAEVLRVGRSASQVRTRMSQDDKPCIEALTMIGTLDPASEPYWSAGVPALAGREFDDCVRLGSVGARGVRVAIMEQVELRLDPDDLGWTRGEHRGIGELHGWLSLPGADFDPVSLLYAVDSFPPATFDVELSGWVPTLELTAYVRALPAPGPVRILHKAQLVEGDRVDEVCFIWDSRGRLVAQATQLAGIRLGR